MFTKYVLGQPSALRCVIIATLVSGFVGATCALASPSDDESRSKHQPINSIPDAVFDELRRIPSIKDLIVQLMDVHKQPRSQERDDSIAEIMSLAKQVASGTHRFSVEYFPHWTNLLICNPAKTIKA